MTATTSAPDYSVVLRVLRLRMEGEKRRKVLAVIAASQAEGTRPTLSEIAERAQLSNGWLQALVLIERLERDGVLRVEWVPGKRKRSGRHRYELLI